MIWKDVPNFEGIYQVSECGDVRSLTRNTISRLGYERVVIGRVLKPFKLPGDFDYSSVTLYINSKRTTILVHRLVASCFCPNDNPDVLNIVNHIDNDIHNNQYTNLEWTTHQGNVEHRHKQGRSGGAGGSKNGRSKLTDEDVKHIRVLLNQGLSQQKIADMYEVNQSRISKIKLNKSYKNA